MTYNNNISKDKKKLLIIKQREKEMFGDLLYYLTVGSFLIASVVLLTWLAVVLLCVVAHYIPATRPAIKKILNPEL